MLQKVVFAFCLSLLFTLTAKAQQPSMWLAGVEMRLGMPQEEVLKRIPERFVVQLLPNSESSYFIRARDRNSDNEYESYGSIGFTNGRLAYAQKDWYGNAGRSDYNLADAIYFVVADVEKRGESILSIRTSDKRQQGFSYEKVTLTFSKRQIVISAFEYKSSKSVQVTEEISSY